MTKANAERSAVNWGVPGAMMALTAIPVLLGVVHFSQLASSETMSADAGRFAVSPAAIGLHLVAVTVYGILGALQFVPRLRSRGSPWHRRMGWVVLACGFVAALTAIWMTLFYPRAANDNTLLYVTRLIVGAAMFVFLVLALVAARRRAFKQHGDWMIRAYALGLGAGTQVLVHLPWFILMGQPDPAARSVLMGGSWLINWLIAEWVIHRGPSRARASRVTSTLR